jgi:hypothetical protein
MAAIRGSSVKAILLAVAMPFLASAAAITFPGATASRSPDGKWEIYSEPPLGGEGHKLQLRAKADGSIRTVLIFPRHVDSQWAPNSLRIAVTDYVGSDMSDCKIVDLKTAQITSVAKALPTELRTVLDGNHHSYVKCGRWRGTDLLEVEIESYGDANPKGISSKVTFDVRSGNLLP